MYYCVCKTEQVFLPARSPPLKMPKNFNCKKARIKNAATRCKFSSIKQADIFCCHHVTENGYTLDPFAKILQLTKGKFR